MGFLGGLTRKFKRTDSGSDTKRRRVLGQSQKHNISSMMVDVVVENHSNEVNASTPRRKAKLSNIPDMQDIALVSTVPEIYAEPKRPEIEESFEQSFPTFTADDNLYASSMMANFGINIDSMLDAEVFNAIEEDDNTSYEEPKQIVTQPPIGSTEKQMPEITEKENVEPPNVEIIIETTDEKEVLPDDLSPPLSLSTPASPIPGFLSHYDLDSSSFSLSRSMSDISLSEGTPTHNRSRSFQRVPSPAKLDSPKELLRKHHHRRPASEIFQKNKLIRQSEVVEYEALKKYKRTMDRLEGLPDVLYTKSVELLCDGWMSKKTSAEKSKKEVRLGMRYLKASADIGSVQAQLDYAEMLVKHSNDKRNKEAIMYLQMATENGSSKAKIILSKLYEYYR
jgi:hypothetical protein